MDYKSSYEVDLKLIVYFPANFDEVYDVKLMTHFPIVDLDKVDVRC